MKYQTLTLPTLGDLRPEFADVELIERTNYEDGAVVPNELRINGVPVHAALGSPFEVRTLLGEALVEVTVTLIAKRVVVGSEPL